ncbi:MAG: NPXTG-anchored protein [Oscillospiraceae bacterium]|nr:NPXTG-anchored protein [Oscillospiraceae bacterium]
MKITKILSTVAAAAVATTALATSAGALLTVVESNGTTASGTGSWLVQVYNTGNPDEGKDPTDYGVDFASTAYIDVVVEVADDSKDWFEGSIGGSIITSCGGDSTNGSHNWPNNEFWGVIDEDLGIETLAADKPVQAEKVGDYTYKFRCTMTDANCFFADSTYVQTGIQEWGDPMNNFTVVSLTLLDASENVILSFDGAGNATVGGGAAATTPDAPVADTETPAAPTTPSKDSPDTGVEGVAAVAGLAVVAAGAVVLSKKRK